MAVSSAQEAYLNTDYPGAVPRASGWDWLTNGLTGNWDAKVENYYADQREWKENKLLQKALWERDDEYYQRLVKDMSKAGLNPYYALNQNLVSPSNSSGQDSYKTRKNKEKEPKDVNLKGIFVAALLLMKLLA